MGDVMRRLTLWRWRRKYRRGCVVSQFLAPDIRRDVEVVDASRISEGIIRARVRTWNVMYAVHGVAPKPAYSEAREVRLKDLWTWDGEDWGGPVPDEGPNEA